MRFFTTEGPVRPADHYCIPPLTRFDLDEVLMLIQQKKYFILHAPRQVGKTSYLLALMQYLNEQGDYACLYFNAEMGQSAREKVDVAERSILTDFVLRANTYLKDPYPQEIFQSIMAQSGGGGALHALFSKWAEHNDKPLVLFMDEIDSLVGDTLISVLRQLRSGYDKRPHSFPHSIVLCGVRDIHDYRIHASSEKTVVTGGSAFNIKAESLRMGDFVRSEVDMLLAEHTTETGQIFESEATDLIWALTNGQPWLVNALAYRVCFKMKPGRDRSQPITAEMVSDAKEQLILERVTHLDQLADKLKEPRVRQVISPMLQGINLEKSVSDDDLQYLIDLGLISRTRGRIQIANPIYREVIPRQLTTITLVNLASIFEPEWYIAPDGQLEMTKLLTAFQEFFREHSEHWVKRFEYEEAGPQLLLQAFLQRVVNGGGRIEREYGLGHGRTDLLIIWPFGDGQAVQKVVLELKIRYGDLQKTIEKGLDQTWRYMDRAATADGHLIIFDRSEKRSWSEKIFKDRRSYENVAIDIWGM